MRWGVQGPTLTIVVLLLAPGFGPALGSSGAVFSEQVSSSASPSSSQAGKNESSKAPTKAASRSSQKTSAAKKTSGKHRGSTRSRAQGQQAPTPDRIKEIQAALARAGYYQAEPTGKWDATTSEAMRRFQDANGLKPTGKIGARSLQLLGLGSEVAGLAPPWPSSPAESPPR